MNLWCGGTSLLFVLAVSVSAAGSSHTIHIVPEEIHLTHRGAAHGILLEVSDGQSWGGEFTVGAVLTSSDPAVAVVENGVVRAVGDGAAVISATVQGETVSAKVTVTGADSPFAPSFRNHVQPVLFKMGCNTGACHGAAAGKNGFKLSLRGYDYDWDHKALTRFAKGRRVSLAEPEQSLILLKPTMAITHEGGLRFEKDSEPYRILLDWIRVGAPPARDEDPRVDRLEVMPKTVTLRPKSGQQLIVRAHYTDGTYEDVTRWAKFDTTDESVAVVDEKGRISVVGPGAASISVWYASKVSSASLTVPRPTPVPAELFAKAERKNFIDDLVLQQLEHLQIAPAGPASETDFVRRAYIDALGVLPTADEVFRFVMDRSPDKRDKLVDELLDRPEYVDYWSYKWSDLLLLSSKNLPRREELSSFYRFIRESVQADKPWDQFARDILTARGNTVVNGAANYFAMHKETIDLTETTSQAFLGMSVTCARCHNHPLEKWTQDDYYGMANLFARVRLKNSDRGTDVLADSFGDIIHPRLGAPVLPKPLDGAVIALDQPGDRREALVNWLVSPENPYFTRAIVNRVWKNFMGRGLVEPEDDLRLTNPASNEALMDALAGHMVSIGYDVKGLIRTIMTSAAYQRSSQPVDPSVPDDKYYSHYIVRRLSAEVILDAYSQVTGVPTEFAGYPKGFRALQLPDSQVGSYFLTAFGRPPRIQTCSCERADDSSVAQALHVANGDTLNKKLSHPESFIARLVERGVKPDKALDEIYVRSLARYPSDQERAPALAVLSEITDPAEYCAALEDLTWAILSSKEFLFNH